MILEVREELLEIGRPGQDRFDRPRRGGVLTALGTAARRDERRPRGRGEGTHATRAHLDAEGRREHILELVGLIDDEGVVLGEYLPAAAQICPEEMEVDDDDVGRGRPAPGRPRRNTHRPRGTGENPGTRRR